MDSSSADELERNLIKFNDELESLGWHADGMTTDGQTYRIEITRLGSDDAELFPFEGGPFEDIATQIRRHVAAAGR